MRCGPRATAAAPVSLVASAAMYASLSARSCSGAALASAVQTSHVHLLSSMSVPTLPVTSASP